MKRQRKWIPDSEIYHLWAHQAQPEGRTRVAELGGINGPNMGKGSRTSFRGPVFYSYSTAIARLGKRKGEEYVILNVTKYSNMTSGHLQSVRQAASHITRKFSVDDQGYGADLSFTPKQLVDYYRNKAEEKSKETHKQKRMMYGILWSAVHWYGGAIEAAEFFGLATKKMEGRKVQLLHQCEQYKDAHDKYEAGASDRQAKREEAMRWRQAQWDKSMAESNRDEVQRFIADPTLVRDVPYHGHVTDDLREQYVAACKVREDWLIEQNKGKLEEWMNGGSVSHVMHELPVRLRMVAYGEGDEKIETSHGAVIPYEDGRKCYRFCARLWKQGKEWRRNGEQFKVGPYHLDAVTRTGIKAGCHEISRETIEAFALAEHWVQSTEDEDASKEKVGAV